MGHSPQGHKELDTTERLSVSLSLVTEHVLLECVGSVVQGHRLSCSKACGIFLDQGSNPCPLHWQVDSLPVSRQGTLPQRTFKNQVSEAGCRVCDQLVHNSLIGCR